MISPLGRSMVSLSSQSPVSMYSSQLQMRRVTSFFWAACVLTDGNETASADAAKTAKSADAVLPNAAAGASAPMLQFESSASAGLSNLYPAEAKSADAVLPNAAAGTRISHAAFLCSPDVSSFALPKRRFITATTAMTTRKITVESAQSAVLIVVCEPLVALTT